MQKGSNKSLCAQGADRRTPGGKPANQYQWVGIWETAKTANQHKSTPKWYPKARKINENGSKIHAKSMKSRGFVADAILERFGCVLGGSPAKRGPRLRSPLATIFDQK